MSENLTPYNPQENLLLLAVVPNENETRMNLIRLQSRLTFEIAVTQPKQISSVRRDNPDQLEDCMIVAVGMLAKSLNVHKNLDGEQVYEIACMLIEKYWMLRPEEIFYVFKQAKLGKYGKVDYSLDIVKVFSWVDSYIENEKVPYFEKYNGALSKELDEGVTLRKLLADGSTDNRLLQQLNLNTKLLK